ncbi:MAG: GNAT family N-acetyltransferase [Candidatus Limivivens sp.]|nr:GNAT family N-acetyltransferase [Candidatus Limivivens sp.]
MGFRNAAMADLDTLMEIYARARNVMRESGNNNQWINGYPGRDLIEKDIRERHCYVYEEDGQIQAVFCLFPGEDPTYREIYEGAWQNDAPYAAIHRIASAGLSKGAAGKCFAWALEQYGNIRIDTHDDNRIMQHVLEKNGFVRCGRIYLEDGSPRVAFQKTGSGRLPKESFC